MYRDHSVGVVVPAYNEENFVAGVVRELPAFVDEIYLVDDASTDGTWAAMLGISGAKSHPQRSGTQRLSTASDGLGRGLLADRVADYETDGRLTRIRHAENRGAGGAVKTGYLAALEDEVDIVATIDGDGQMDAALLPRILDPVVEGRAGYAKGDRLAGVSLVHEMPPFRLFGNLLLTGLTRIATGYWKLSDPQNGFTAISREALLEADVESLWEYYGYMNQLLARLNAAGVGVADVPMASSYGDEVSGIDYVEYIRKVSWLLLVSFLLRLRRKYVDEDWQGKRLAISTGLVGVALALLARSVRAEEGRNDRGEIERGNDTRPEAGR
ncbi:glycosyltransferase family 2 protein [Halorussus halophilus]|uniref:glycosyltransferase family 2 protein n=1 Tax=Halorussus halophilus TaxID=2650975 RepID=UPI001300EE44|nr:glycosyltransferase family 2 protein [Halorussus halophilus]